MNRRSLPCCATLACIGVVAALYTAAVCAAPGDLDASFGVGGKVTTDFGCCGGGANGVAIQADGKLIAVGASGAGAFALARYNRDGTLDSTFGSGGIVTTAIGIFDVFRAVAVQTDGKIVAAGSSCSPTGGCYQFAIVRYNSDGSLDTSFGLGGSVITTYSSAIQAFAMAIQPDGKIVAAGGTLSPFASDFILARYNSDGSLDSGFGQGGLVTTSFSGVGLARGVAIQKDGKIVAVGAGGPSNDFALARYNPNGTLDTGFGSAGQVTKDFGSYDSANAVVIQPDGKIVAAGVGGNRFTVVRFNADGTLDTGFNGTGAAQTLFSGQNIETANSLALQTNLKIVVAGVAFVNFVPYFALARFNSDGSIDTSFHGNGQVTTSFGSPSEDQGNGVLIQSDGMIVAAGGAGPTIPPGFFALARYQGDPIGSAEDRDVSPDTAVAFGASETFLFRGTREVLVAADRSGMHRTDDLGDHWRRSMKGLVDAASGIEPLAALVCQAPSARSTVYVPTLAAADPLLVDRPYRSDDFGATWRPLAGLVNASSSDCAVDPLDPNVLYVLAGDVNDGHELLFKSIDGGRHFSAVGSGLEQNDCPHSMRVSPHNRNTVYVLDNGTFGGLYVSTDGGLHFVRSPSSPANPGTCALGVTEVLFFHPTEPETLFVVTLTGLFRSTDGGATFRQPSGLPASAQYVAFDPSDAHTSYVAAGTAGLYRSTDDGASYSRLPGPTAGQLGHFGVALVGIPPGGASIYISTSYGLLRSDDGGQTFAPSQDDFHGAVVNDLAFDATGRLLVGTFHTLQLFRGAQPGHPEPYESPGATIVPGGETMAIAGSPADANVLLVALWINEGVFRTDDGGATWTSVSGIATPIRTFGRLTFAPNDASRAYYVNIGPGAVAGFYRSIDEGRSFAHTFQERLGSVAADPSNANTVYVGTWDNGHGLFKSTDGGLTFTSLPLIASQAGDFGSVAIDPTDPQTVYAGRRQGGVLRSDDGGATWSFVSGLPGGEVLGVALDPQRPAHVFAWIQGAGLFRSDDRGGTWRAADTGEAKRRSGVEAGRGTLVADPKVSGRVYIGNSGVVQIDTEE